MMPPVSRQPHVSCQPNFSRQMVRRAMLVNSLAAAAACVGLGSGALAGPREGAIRIVAFGDSLTAGYGLKPGEAFPPVLERRLKAKGHRIEIANAGVSGDTTAGGLARLDWSVPEGTEAVILELGANDALGGRSPEDARRNLETIVKRLKARGIDVLLTGMRAPRNLGNDYANRFDRIFPELAEAHDLILYPFFLTGIALDPKLNLPDGIHPTAAGVVVIAERILPSVEELIDRVAQRRKAAPRG